MEQDIREASPWYGGLVRFFRRSGVMILRITESRIALVGLIISLIVLLTALTAPWLATHDPIKAFRTRTFMQPDAEGKPVLKYATHDFDADIELNLEEVVQVIGFDRIWVPVVFDCPYELDLSSCINLDAYISYLAKEYDRMTALVRQELPGHQSVQEVPAGPQPLPPENQPASQILQTLEQSNCKH